MTNKNQDLTARLRERKSNIRTARGPGAKSLQRQDDPLCREAADAIDAQALEISRLETDLARLREAVGELMAHQAWHGSEEDMEIWADKHWQALKDIA